MKRTIAFITFLAFSNFGMAQSLEWAGKYGGDGEDVVVGTHIDNDGNIYSTGYYTLNCDFDISEENYTIAHDADYEIFVSKTDANGNFVWAKSFGGVSGENGTAITSDAAGNVYVTGVYQETADFDPGDAEYLMTAQGMLDIFVIKLDPDGNLLWAKSIGGTDYESTTGIGVDAIGNIYVSGYFYFEMDFDPGSEDFIMSPAGSGDGFAVKLNPDGNFLWAKQFGGEDFELATGLKVLANGDSYYTGNFTGTADFNPSVDATYTLSTPANHDGIFLLRLNKEGDFVNAFRIAECDFHMYGLSVDVDTDGNAYVAGYFGGNVSFPQSENPVESFSSMEYFNAYAVKVNSAGTVLWAKFIDAELGSQGYDIAVNSVGEVLVLGFYSGNLTLDSVNITPPVSENAQENYLAKYNANGTLISSFQFGGANFIDTATMGIDQEDNIYLSAAFENSVDINPVPDQDQIVASTDFRDNFIIRLNNTTLSVPDQPANSIALYPNPVNDILNVRSQFPLEGVDFVLVDITGKNIMSGKFSTIQQVDMADVANGVYLMKIGNDAFRILKQ